METLLIASPCLMQFCVHTCVCVRTWKNGHENALTRSPSLLHGYFAAALFNSINLRHPQTNEACSGKGAAAAVAKTTPREKRTTLENPRKKGKVSALGFAYGNKWGVCVCVCMSECCVGRRAYDQFLLLR